MNDHARAWLARSALDSTSFIEGRQSIMELLELTASEIAEIEGLIEHHRLAIGDVERLLPDADLRAAYQRTSGRTGDPEADALQAEIERRGLQA